MLHELLIERMAETGLRNQTAATVMAPHRDPYRMEKYRAEAEWLHAASQTITVRPLHVRGLHYASIGSALPVDVPQGKGKPPYLAGSPYPNTEAAYLWMGDKPAKAARWLDLIDWDELVDKKNDAPTVYEFAEPSPDTMIRLGQIEVELPEELVPTVHLADFRAVQPYRLVIFAEKAAVAPVVLPIAQRYGIDTYFMGGEISDTHLRGIAATGEEDGRPTIVLPLCDADPSGYWMPATIAYKLYAFRDGWFGDFEFEVVPIGFLPEQVHAINAQDPSNPLPSSPLKDGEKRGDAWGREFGIEQVELDAIATLRPEQLDRIVKEGVWPFIDRTLDRRVREARQEYERAAQAALETQLGPEAMAQMRRDGEERLTELSERIDEINDQLWIDTAQFVLPDLPELPTAELNGTPYPLGASSMEFTDLVARLKDRAAYTKR